MKSVNVLILKLANIEEKKGKGKREEYYWNIWIMGC